MLVGLGPLPTPSTGSEATVPDLVTWPRFGGQDGHTELFCQLCVVTLAPTPTTP